MAGRKGLPSDQKDQSVLRDVQGADTRYDHSPIIYRQGPGYGSCQADRGIKKAGTRTVRFKGSQHPDEAIPLHVDDGEDL